MPSSRLPSQAQIKQRRFSIKAKYTGKCRYCGGAISPGDNCNFYPDSKQVSHRGCEPTTEYPPQKPVDRQQTFGMPMADAHRPPR